MKKSSFFYGALFTLGVTPALSGNLESKTPVEFNTAACQMSQTWCVGSRARVEPHVANQVLLSFDNKSSKGVISEVMNHFNLLPLTKDIFDSIDTTLVAASTNGQLPKDVAEAVNAETDEVKASVNSLFYTAAQEPQAVDKPEYPHSLTGIAEAHKFTKGAGVKIGMIDSPIDILHRSLNNNKVSRMELTPPGNELNQLHGTAIAGILISKNPRIGIAPDAQLLAVSAFSTDPKKPNTRVSNARLIAKALDVLIENRVDVANLSFTGTYDPVVEKLIKKAIARGMVVVASAGNKGPKAKAVFPASIKDVVAVTAVDRREKVYSQANRGSYIDLSAPGVDILSTAPRGSFETSTGTSLATAHVTGVIALMLALNKSKFRTDMLTSTAVDLGQSGQDDSYGHGLVSVQTLLKKMR